MSGLLPTDTEATGSDGPVADATAGSGEGVDSLDSIGNGDDDDIRICWLDDEDADALIGSLSSETARSVLTALHDEPSTASNLADTTDTSVQNVRHHLENLQDAGLVTVTGTRYSVKGREMTVYGPASERLVVAVGDDDRTTFLDSLRGVLGILGLLGGASLLVRWLFGAGVVQLTGPQSIPRIEDSMADATGMMLGVLPPDVAFLAGGLLVLMTVLAVEHVRDN